MIVCVRAIEGMTRHRAPAIIISFNTTMDRFVDGRTPLVIMPEKVPAHLEGTDEKINNLEWICYYEDVDQLRQLLSRLLSSSE